MADNVFVSPSIYARHVPIYACMYVSLHVVASCIARNILGSTERVTYKSTMSSTNKVFADIDKQYEGKTESMSEMEKVCMTKTTADV